MPGFLDELILNEKKELYKITSNPIKNLVLLPSKTCCGAHLRGRTLAGGCNGTSPCHFMTNPIWGNFLGKCFRNPNSISGGNFDMVPKET